MTSTDELFPCPFCGCEVRMRMHSYLGAWYTIRGEHTPSCPMRKVWRNYADEAEAIEAWNTRAERTCRDTGECRWFCCSECGFGFNDMYANKEREFEVDVSFPKYCPNCGARVKEE